MRPGRQIGMTLVEVLVALGVLAAVFTAILPAYMNLMQANTLNNLQYEVVTRFCPVPDLCNQGSRHLIVEVSHDGNVLFTVETVYTQLR